MDMKHMPDMIKNYLIYCGLDREQYGLVKSRVTERNYDLLGKSSAVMTIYGMLFLIYNLVFDSDLSIPHIILAAGGLAILILRRVFPRPAPTAAMTLCYALIILVFASGILLSIQIQNIYLPSTSIIVMLAIIPFTVTDRPVRMFAVTAVGAAVFLFFSYKEKMDYLYHIDQFNTLSFVILGMILYLIVSARNVKEIYEHLRVENMQEKMILTLADIIEERDQETGEHIRRTEDYVALLTEEMMRSPSYSHLKHSFYENVRKAAPLHDIGKIRIPDCILEKPGKLTDEEFETMKQHSRYGAEIIKKTLWGVEEKEYSDIAYNVALCHHERYDGKGYPEGLSGEDIPLEGRIMQLADVYDALLSKRVYKDAFSANEAAEIIRSGAGTQFDPDLTDLFLNAVSREDNTQQY